MVADDATFASVDQEHSAGLEPALFDDGVLGEIDDADLGCHDDEAVLGDPVAARSEAVSVENGAHDGAVGEGDGRGAVPWLHAGGVVLVERLPIGVHLVVVLPRLGDHHQHRLGERVPTEAQQFERLVEAGGVARSRGADRERPLEAWKVWRTEQCLTGAHPIAVALDRVDLAVVSDDAIRVRQRPRREGVGREPRVHQGHGTFDALIDQVGVKRSDLRCREHPLVDEGSCAQRRHVDALVRLGDATHGLVGCPGACVDGNLTLDALAGDERQAVEVNTGGAVVGRHEDLPEDRHRHERRRAKDRFVDGHLPPTEHVEAFSLENALDFSGRCIRHARLLREKRHAGGVGAGLGKVEGDDVSEEAIRNLDQDASAIAGVDVGAACTAVLEIAERADRLGDDLVALAAVHVAHEVEPARVVLVPGW